VPYGGYEPVVPYGGYEPAFGYGYETTVVPFGGPSRSPFQIVGVSGGGSAAGSGSLAGGANVNILGIPIIGFNGNLSGAVAGAVNGVVDFFGGLF